MTRHRRRWPRSTGPTTSTSNPTSAHLLGDYSRAGRVRGRPRGRPRTREIADAARLRAAGRGELDEGGLDEQQRHHPRRAGRRRHRPGRPARARGSAELAADPIFGDAGRDADHDRDAGAARRRRSPRRWSTSCAGSAATTASWPSGSARASRTAGCPPRSRCATRSPSSTACSPRRSPTTRCCRPRRPPPGSTSTAGRPRLRAVIESDVRPGMAAYRDVLRDEVLPAGPARRAVRAELARRRRRRRTPRPCATSRPPTRPPRRSTTSGWPRSRSWPTSTARSGPRWSAPTTSSRSSRRCAPTRSCTSRPATQLVEASEVAMARAWDAMPEWFEVLPQAPCAVQSHDDRRQGVLLPAGRRRQPRRHLLRQRRRPVVLGHLRAGVDGLPRGHPRPPPAARDRQRARATCRSSASTCTTRRTPRAGASTPSGSPTRWGSTPRPSTGWGCTPPTRCAPAGSSSTPACTRSAGAASRRSTTWSTTRRWPRAMCRPEIDRYIVSPGQATSYMVGRLEIQRMRAEAEQRQGSGFDGQGGSTPPCSTPARCRSACSTRSCRRLPA